MPFLGELPTFSVTKTNYKSQKYIYLECIQEEKILLPKRAFSYSCFIFFFYNNQVACATTSFLSMSFVSEVQRYYFICLPSLIFLKRIICCKPVPYYVNSVSGTSMGITVSK